MTKAELIDRIARSRDLPPDISKKLIGQILGVAFDELASYFARSRVTRSQSPRFTFPHFGTFTKKRRSARRGVNPRTLEPIQIEACNTIDFKVSRELREAMNPAKAGDSAEPEGSSEAAGGSVRAPRAALRSGSRGGSRGGSTKKANKKVGRKKTKARAAVKPRRASRSVAVAGPNNRRLTPRDDEAELSALMDEKGALFESEPKGELPSSPMQRVKGRRRTRSRGTG
ncbi:MAG: HU family DNA-binding protein [Myxococcota bacterium]